MADIDLPPIIAKVWTEYPTIFCLSREELAEASAFVELWERGFVTLDDMPTSIRLDLISYLSSLVNRTRQVGVRDAGVEHDGYREKAVGESNDGTLLKRFASALSGLSKKAGRM